MSFGIDDLLQSLSENELTPNGAQETFILDREPGVDKLNWNMAFTFHDAGENTVKKEAQQQSAFEKHINPENDCHRSESLCL